MARLCLRPDIGFCRFDGATIILDTAADRYWQADDDLGSALDAARAAGAIDAGHEAALRLTELGLATPEHRAEQSIANPLPPPPEESVVETGAGELHDALAAEICALSLWWRAMVRARPLRRNLDIITRRRTMLFDAAPRDDVRIRALALTFRRWRRVVPLKPLCLPDSLALSAFLLRHGHRAQLVFGVEAHPFSAHCWVQQGPLVLNDALGHVELFRPILAV